MTDFQAWLTSSAADIIADTAAAVDVEAMLARLPRRDTVLDDPFAGGQFEAAIERLGERDRLIVALHYFTNLSMPEIGQVLGVTESRACQLHSRAMIRLQAMLTEVPDTPSPIWRMP